MKWFRLYSEVLNDPKVQSLRPELFKFWINLLCLANVQKERGSLPPTPEIAFQLRMRPDRVARFLAELQARHLLVTGASGPLQPHNWDVRQPQSDHVAERVRRSRQRSSAKLDHPDVTLQGAAPPVTVYVPELEREEEKEIPLTPFGGSGACAGACGLEEEPFVSPAPCLAPEPPPAVANDPAEVARVEAKAERLFPMHWFGTKVRALAGDYPMPWVEHALEDAHAAGVGDWRYVLGIVRRLAREGGPRLAPATPARLATADPELTVHRASLQRAAEIEATYRPRPPRTPRGNRPGA
jgi:hypothetical protein